jgi:hypothetical protein
MTHLEHGICGYWKNDRYSSMIPENSLIMPYTGLWYNPNRK